MNLSPLERVLLGVTVVIALYRYVTDDWPIQVEVVEE